jgi:hypothetical protein
MTYKPIFKLGESENKKLLDSLSGWFEATKSASLKAISFEQAKEKGVIEEDGTVNTKEGKVKAKKGSMICMGIEGELWVQEEKRLEDKYTKSNFLWKDVVKDVKWRIYNPKKEENKVRAVQVNDREEFTVKASWGNLKGKKGDYILQDIDNPDDVWIIDKNIFSKTYKYVS